MYTATLRCGTVLSYEERNFLPAPGEPVPCCRHGYCIVDTCCRTTRRELISRAVPRARTRTTPRAQEDLVEWLRGRRVTTVHVLRKHRFTLRVIVAAERDGLIALDLETGTVTLRRGAHE